MERQRAGSQSCLGRSVVDRVQRVISIGRQDWPVSERGQILVLSMEGTV